MPVIILLFKLVKYKLTNLNVSNFIEFTVCFIRMFCDHVCNVLVYAVNR